MRWLGLMFCLACFAAVAQAGEKFPYAAYVVNDEVFVRSGPGKNYYPTSKLTRGESVEVYRHDPGGWCAIRPPRRSYSWIPASQLKIDRDGIATVVADQTPVRVGSNFSEMRDTIQVRLDRGELVEVLETHPLGEGSERQEWCMIAPPSVEFRWVYAKYLGRNASELDDEPAERGSPRAGNELARSQRASEDQRYDNIRLTAGEDEIRDTRITDRNWRQRDDTRPATSTGSRSRRGNKSLTPEEAYQAELDEIDLELSVVVAAEPNTWRFDDLRQRADAASRQAATAVERGKARELQNKILRFEEIKQRYDAVASNPLDRRVNRPISGGILARDALSPNPSTDPFALPGSSPASRRAAGLTGAPGMAAAGGVAASDPRFDGRGKLTPVVSQRPNAPRYALVDGSGQVTTFITPGPGVNLQPFVGREVGITGERGYMPELKKPHVTALRVTPTESTVMR